MKKAYNREPTEKYICRICGTKHKVKGFSSHLKFKHDGIAFLDYVKKFINEFPEDFPKYYFCPICKENITEKGNGSWPGTCSKKCKKIVQSDKSKGRNIWSEMSPETKQIARRKISEKATIKGQGRNIWAEMDEETSKNARKLISQKTGARVKGEGNPMFGKTHSPETIQKILTRKPKTSIEEKISNFLDENEIQYYFQFFISKESTHSYDFKIKGIPLIIEADGDYWHGGPGSKKHFFRVNECMETDKIKNEMAKASGYIIIRFWGSEIENNFDYVKTQILEEIKKFWKNK